MTLAYAPGRGRDGGGSGAAWNPVPPPHRGPSLPRPRALVSRRCYWIDQETGERRPNPFNDRQSWREFLNRLTIRRYRLLLRDSPFETVHFQPLGFGGTRYRLAGALRGLGGVPLLREFFAHAVFAVARKPIATRLGETRTRTPAA